MALTPPQWLALARMPGLGNRRLLTLLDNGLEQNPTPQSLLMRAEPSLAQQLESELAQAATPANARHEADLAWLAQEHNHLLTIDDPRYPELLREIDEPPAILFIRGDVDLLGLPQLAIVGSRNPSRGGRDNAYAFARHLATSGLLITSGMALGIDAQAHRGCLAADTPTLAVVGTGTDRVYPASHHELAHQIATQGAIVSEFPPGTAPKAGHFPRRNRLISGLSLGTLVVEAALKSGSLITARLAAEQGREVFAIPGSIHNPLSRGCHQLIRQGAKLIESSQDIIDELAALLGSLQMTEQTNEIDHAEASLDEEYHALLDAMGWDPVGIEQLVGATGLSAAEISSMLLLLELQGHVSSAPGGSYCRSKPLS